nr:MAG TPA_asm: hypothetical protein [Caudoviricetes sp.]
MKNVWHAARSLHFEPSHRPCPPAAAQMPELPRRGEPRVEE